jgi:hypothetical protein
LELRECIIDHQGLESVFSRCPNLGGVSITLGDARLSVQVPEHEWTASANEFGGVFRENGQTLTTLNLHTMEADSGWSDEDGLVSSLKELKELRHVAFLKDDIIATNAYGENHHEGRNLHMKELIPSNLETIYTL